MIAHRTLAAINNYIEENQERDHRTHLGASVLGRECARQVWYGFRWAATPEFDGQRLRLFDRGNEFEPHAVEWLRNAGMTIWEVDPATGQQFRISDCLGHFGGSLDGKGINCPDLPPDSPFLLETKTHCDKSFKALQKQGLCGSKGDHFAQMQSYMFKASLEWGLYLANNKDNDKIHVEIIELNPPFAATLIDKAKRVIFSEDIPKRIGGPGHFICKSKCDVAIQQICHHGAIPNINCRTCRFSKPVADAQWVCTKYGNFVLTKEMQKTGCESHQLIPGFLEKSY